MSEVIKGSSPINNIIIEGTVEISNRIAGLDDVEPKKEIPESEEAESDENEEPEEEEERFTVNYEELEALREQYRKEGEEQVKYLVQRSEQELANARSQADDIVKKAQTEAASILAQADKEAEFNKSQAAKDGFSEGFEEGMKKGMDDGYTAGVKKCAETMEDLKRLYAEYGREKDGLMSENRRAIFDLSMSIAEKITMTVFTQKSKNALEKMISAAAKEFRKAKNIRVTMSKLDITEDFIADSEILQKCFPQTANVEYELLDNAERGTLLVEGDSEILDAGVSTQLKMIEELGRGKFREKEPEQITEALTDTAENVAAEQQEKPKKRRQSSAGATHASEPVHEAVDEPALELVSEIAVENTSDNTLNNSYEPVSEAVDKTVGADTGIITETAEPILEIAEEKVSATEENNLAELSSDLSADDLAAAVDSLLAEAGLDMDNTGEEASDSEEEARNDVISLTKAPVISEDGEE